MCQAYWYPLYAFIRRRDHDPEAARDLTQEFFARLLEADFLAGLDRAKGK
jgi:RNA polymerase sigma-70 factor (ECF subfamily)